MSQSRRSFLAFAAIMFGATGCGTGGSAPESTSNATPAGPATSQPMTHHRADTGITLLESRDGDTHQIQNFAIIEGQEEVAANHLIGLLSKAEISLMNGEDEGGEGATTIRKTTTAFEARNNGHGWQGDWKEMTADEIRQRIIQLAPHNRGGHWSLEGSITR